MACVIHSGLSRGLAALKKWRVSSYAADQLAADGAPPDLQLSTLFPLVSNKNLPNPLPQWLPTHLADRLHKRSVDRLALKG